MNNTSTNHEWVIEERLALVPVVGKMLVKSLPKSGLLEEKIAFGSHPHQYVYLVWPDRPDAIRRSAVLFLHGGGWSTGNPLLFRFVGRFFAGMGFPTLLGGYRLAPEARFPAQIEDVTAGLEAGLQALAARDAPIARVIAGGQSAGAHLASLLAYDRSRQTASTERVSGLFAISGPINFSVCDNPSLQEMIDGLVGSRSAWDAADPIRFVRGDERTPALFIHGDRDPLVDVQNSITFAGRLAQGRSCPVELHLVRGGHHADLAGLFLGGLSVTQAFVKWLEWCDRS